MLFVKISVGSRFSVIYISYEYTIEPTSASTQLWRFGIDAVIVMNSDFDAVNLLQMRIKITGINAVVDI